jgi:hypothetical protein
MVDRGFKEAGACYEFILHQIIIAQGLSLGTTMRHESISAPAKQRVYRQKSAFISIFEIFSTKVVIYRHT